MKIDFIKVRHYLGNWLVSWAGISEGIVGVLSFGLKMPSYRLWMCRFWSRKRWFKKDW